MALFEKLKLGCRQILALTCALMLTASATADSPVVEACKSAALHLTMMDLNFLMVQDFSELEQPRARLLLSDNGIIMRCTFESAEPPLNLVEFCFPSDTNCVSAGDSDFDEVRHLLELEGR